MTAANQQQDSLRLEHLRALWDHAPHAVWVHQHMRLVYINQACVTALGATKAEQLLDRSPLDFIGERFRAHVAQRIEAIQHDSVVAPMIALEFQRLDGTTFPAQGIAWNIAFEGAPAVQATFYDTTAVTRIEAALLASERDREQLVELLPQLVWTTRPDGHAEFFNQRWYDYTGLSQAASQGHGWTTVLHPDDVEHTVDSWNEAVQDARHYAVEYRLRAADGSYRWFLVRANPLLDSTGAVTRWFGTSTDIDEQRRAEDRLRENEERFRTATHAVSDLLWTNDADGLMHGEQPGWSNYTGQSEAEYQGYGWSAAVHPDDAQLTIDAWKQAVAQKRMFIFEHRVRRYDGVYRLFRIRALPIQRDDGTIREWVGVHTDITDRRAQLEEIRRLNAHLEERVRQRTAELEAANHDLESFSYSVCHDLRSPLRSVDGYSLALQEDAALLLTPQTQGYIHRIRNGVERMSGLIDALMQLSRITRGELDRHSVDISRLAAEAAEQAQSLHPDRTVAIHIEPGLLCQGDSRLLQVALSNLIGNAFKFTVHAAHPEIWFGSGRRNDGVVEYYVRDNGAGFDMRYAEKLFQPFQRLHGEKDFTGSGIGLATVRRVISRHGGSVRAEGRTGHGATFFFTLG